MADWQTYSEDKLPISIPPVDIAWQNMRSRLDAGSLHRAEQAKKALLTLALLMSWLVIFEPREKAGRNNQDPIQHAPLEATDAIPAIDKPSLAEGLPWIPAPKRGYKRRTALPGSGQPSIMDEPDVTPLAQTHIVDGSASEPNLTNDLFDRTDTIAPASIKPTDTTKTEKVLKEEKEEVKKTEEKWQLSGGLQWESQIPTTGLEGYFHGSNNKAQPWRILVPGLYLEAVQGKNAINISFLPMFSQSVARKTFRIQDTLFRSGDSLIARNADKALYKLLGMQASIGYARNMHGNWWYGLSLDAAFWQQGLVKVDGREVNLLSQIANERSYTERYRISDEWSYFNKTQMFVEGSIQYRKNRWQAALKTGIAFTPLSKGDGPAHMFRGALNFRYMLKNR